MAFEFKIRKIQSTKFDKIVSIGVRCIPSTTMVKTRLKQETYTFDWIQSNPQIVLDCIKDNFKKYNNFNQNKVSDKYDMHIRYDDTYNHVFPKKLINEYGMCFTHYKDYSDNVFIKMCKRRSERFMKLLQSNKKILFVYMNDKNKKLQEKQYSYLLELRNYLTETYPGLDYTILSIQDIKKDDSIKIINLQTRRQKGVITINGKRFGSSYDLSMENCFRYVFKTHKKYPQQKIFQ